MPGPYWHGKYAMLPKHHMSWTVLFVCYMARVVENVFFENSD